MELSKFNPANSDQLKHEEIFAEMNNLSRDQINELAKAYPNEGNNHTYLVLKDKSKPDNQQLFPLSTWENLKNLYNAGQTQFVPHSFTSVFKREQARNTQLQSQPAQDLTDDEIRNAEGLRKNKTQAASEEKGRKAASQIHKDQTAEEVNNRPVKKTSKKSKKAD